MTDILSDTEEHLRLREFRKFVQPLFDSSAWPGTSEEEWRRTDISVFEFDQLGEPEAGLLENTSAEIKSGNIRRLNDVLVAADNGEEIIPKAALDRIFAHLEKMRETASNRIALWNMLKAEDIFVLHIPSGSETGILHELCWHSLGDDISRHAAFIVVAETMSRARVALRLKGMGGHLQNFSSYFIVDDAADLGISVLQESSDEVVAFYQADAVVGRDAKFLHFEGLLGAGFIKNRVEVALSGSGADLHLNGIYFGDDEQHIDMRTVQHHQADHAESRTYYKGAVRDEAQTVFQGLIEVNREAGGTDAYLTNKNMVLNDGARADSIPSLNIKTDDVKCSHGSTTGKIDEDHIFYLQSRGFSRKDAEELLILGYFEDLLADLPDKMQNDVRQQIHRRLKGRG